jgi:uncharacterized protein
MLRASSYTIYVALPNTDDEMLLVHGYTGAYDRVSRDVANYVRSLEDGPAPKPLYGDWATEPSGDQVASGGVKEPSTRTIEILKRRGYLTSRSLDQEAGYVARLTKRLHARPTTPVYIVMPTYQCNLRCAYCFQDHMRTKPEYKHLLRTMTTEMVDRLIASWQSIETDQLQLRGPFRRSVLFFGGEPLLAESRPVVEYFMRNSGEADFSAITNATELDAYTDLLGPSGLSWLQITLDGPPTEHDQRRVYADGSGSFDRIAGNIDLALSRGVRVAIRLNIDRQNVVRLPELADLFSERAWDQNPLFSCYTAPIHNTKGGDLTQIRSKYFNSWDLENAIGKLRSEHPRMRSIDGPDEQLRGRARRVFQSGLEPGAAPYLKTAFCGAHSGMYIFDVFGDIYACWEKTGDPSIRIGHVNEGSTIDWNDGLNKLWRTRTPASNPVCRKCRYALHCGGGCAVLAEGASGKYHSNYCDGFADRFRSAVADAYVSFMRGDVVSTAERICDM